jgi:5-methylcytosine-specific restriction endonuclease McrA
MGRAHFDHVIPLARGGEHNAENIRTACRSCNDRKLDRMPTPALIARIGEEVRLLAA